MILLNISEHVNLYSKHSNEFSKTFLPHSCSPTKYRSGVYFYEILPFSWRSSKKLRYLHPSLVTGGVVGEPPTESKSHHFLSETPQSITYH